MRARAILNRDGGTLARMDVDAVGARLADAFARNGRSLDVEIVAGEDLIAALERAEVDAEIDAIVAGGGDGTVSAAAGAAWRGGKALGVLPAGTMNLFARALGLPLDLDQAIAALATAAPAAIDIATADGRPFVHQVSIGLQPETVRARRAFEYQGRIGKMWASLRAAIRTFRQAPTMRVGLHFGGDTVRGRFSFVAVTNNPYGEGHMPYPDRLDTGLLGVYWAERLRSRQAARLAADLLRGQWRANRHLSFASASAAELTFPARRGAAQASIDGELVPLAERLRIEMHPGALMALAPRAEGRRR